MVPPAPPSHPAHIARHPARHGPGQPFETAEQAWFWTMGALRARHEGAACSGRASVPRPCDPDDILRCLDRLYRHRRIDLGHARILRRWGERQVPPRPDGAAHRDAVLWREALDRLDGMLREKGIVQEQGKNSLTPISPSA